MFNFWYKLKNLIYWIPIIWVDQDNHYGFIVTILIKKLDRTRKFMVKKQPWDKYYYHTDRDRKRIYKQISEIIEHFNRYRDPHGFDAIDHYYFEVLEETDQYTTTNIKRILKYDRCFPDLQADNIELLQQWHWGEAWRKLAKYSKYWWD